LAKEGEKRRGKQYAGFYVTRQLKSNGRGGRRKGKKKRTRTERDALANPLLGVSLLIYRPAPKHQSEKGKKKKGSRERREGNGAGFRDVVVAQNALPRVRLC